ncbi:DEAD/DEAH box helicase [Cupriavidus sp. BIS7]|uniref:DEAD/DEAH box helicase n=1 Tax=Cupriavidus sp. BIS7 TaxID=1217718 RepID=UPI0002F71DB4|nr:DEAD/DEAH box helicase [Cupriavidus sp. BIS7]
MRISKLAPSLSVPNGAPFAALRLAPALQATLTELGLANVTPLQAAMLPGALAGHDLIVQSPAGSGRILAFTIALLHRLDPRRFDVQALVLCPTRDRAQRVSQRIRDCARAARHVKVVTLSQGSAMRSQIDSLIHGAHIVVGTPGRVLDHIESGSLDLRAVGTLVLDETDTMLDMGFADDIVYAASRCPKDRQTLLLSSSGESDLPPGIARLARHWLRKPQRIFHFPA